jgi:prolipoprotein diacylglyceryl transferase
MHIPSPPVNGFHVGPLYIHYYGLMYVIGITLAILITQRRWQRMGGDAGLVGDVALWAVPAGIIGGRIYFDITTPQYIPHHWYGIFAVWDGGLGIWGGIAFGAAAGIWRVRRAGANAGAFADAVAPALLVAQAVGRIGNYFNKELFGGPTSLPWGLYIPPGSRPAGYLSFTTFQPTFLYELIFDLALAAGLVWLGHHRAIKVPGLFALYVTGYSAFRIFEESLRVDPSEHFLGLRLNMFVAIAGTVAGGAWFWYTQRRGKGLPSNTPDLAAASPARDGAVTADAAVDDAAGGAGEPPAQTEGESAGAAGSDDTAESAAGTGPGGAPHAEVGAESAAGTGPGGAPHAEVGAESAAGTGPGGAPHAEVGADADAGADGGAKHRAPRNGAMRGRSAR